MTLGGVTRGLEEGVMLARCLVAAVILITACCSEALAIWQIPEFGDVVERADICVYGEVTHAKKLGEQDGGYGSFTRLMDFAVERVVLGACRKGARIQVYYRSCEVDDSAYSPGERYVLFLRRTKPPLSGWESRELHWGAFRVGDDGSLTVPESLRSPPKSGRLSEFLKEILYVRGPEVTARLARASFASDEAITLTVTLRNPSSLEMLVALPARERSPYCFRALFFTAGGLPLHSLCWPLTPEHRKSVPYLLMPGKSVTRAISFEPPLHVHAERSYRTLAKMALTYDPNNIGAVEGTWRGAAYSKPVPVRIVSRCPAIDRTLGDAGEKYAFRLMLEPEVVRFASGEPVNVWTIMAYRTFPADERRMVRSAVWGWGTWVEPSDKKVDAMVRQLEVRRDGKLVEPSKPASRGDRWVQEAVKADPDLARTSWKKTGFDFRLDRYFDLARPGRYTVRLVVPPKETGEKRPLASNLIEFTVVGLLER